MLNEELFEYLIKLGKNISQGFFFIKIIFMLSMRRWSNASIAMFKAHNKKN